MSESPKTLTKLQAEKLLAAFDWERTGGSQSRKKIRNRCMALLMLDAGLRIGEVVKLQKTDVYFNGQASDTIFVMASRSKSKTDREIPASTRLKKSLDTYLTEHLWLRDYADSTIVFGTGESWHPMSTRQVERIITAAGMLMLGKPVNPHMLRHTCATRLMKVTSMRVVQKLLGHKHITSTQIYTHPDNDDCKKAIEDAEEHGNLI